MTSRGKGPRREIIFLLLVACTRLYGALLVLYPKAFRQRYSAELRRDFFGLSREALGEGGLLGLVRVWAHAFSALVLTAIRRRSTTLPMERRVASAMVMMLQVAVVAVIVAMVGLWQGPTYEIAGLVWMTDNPDGKRAKVVKIGGASYAVKPPGRPEKIEAIRNATHTPSVAKEVIRRLELQMEPAELLDNLTIVTLESETGGWNSHRFYDKHTVVSRVYQDPDPKRAQQIVNMVGQVAFENSSRIGYETAPVPPTPVPENHPDAPHALRNGLLTLAIGLALCLILKRRELKYVLTNRGAARDATYYLWETRYAYYLSLGQTISAKATVAVGLFVAVALSIASMVGGGGSKPSPFD